MSGIIVRSIAAGLMLSGCFLYEDEKPDSVDTTDYTLSLELLDHDCISATFRLSMAGDSALNKEWLLLRDADTVMAGRLSGQDTILTDTGLFPSTSYHYQGIRIKQGEAKDSSDVILLTSRDTTSSEFEWEKPEYFAGASWGLSHLRDIQIVDENNIWVVGAIYEGPSWEEGWFYNALHWNGKDWEKLTFYSKYDVRRWKGDEWKLNHYSKREIVGIQYFNEHSIWFAAGVASYFDGDSMTMYNYPYFSTADTSVWARNLWGSRPDNMYFGYNGELRHWDGEKFTRIHTGIRLATSNNMYMDADSKGNLFITCPGSYGERESYFLKVSHFESEILYYSPSISQDYMYQVEVIEDVPHILCNYGIKTYKEYKKDFDFFVSRDSLDQSFRYRNIRGQARNDLILFSLERGFYHYNGKSWTFQDNPYLPHDISDPDVELFRMEYKDGIFVCVGDNYHNRTELVIIKGKRIR